MTERTSIPISDKGAKGRLHTVIGKLHVKQKHKKHGVGKVAARAECKRATYRIREAAYLGRDGREYRSQRKGVVSKIRIMIKGNDIIFSQLPLGFGIVGFYDLTKDIVEEIQLAYDREIT